MDFGFKISKGRSIDLDRSDMSNADALFIEKSGLRRCMDCGTCTATCPAGGFTPFNIRKIHTLFRRGQYDSLQEELSKCMLCGKCTLVCPRSVNLRGTIIKMRTLLSSAPEMDEELDSYLHQL